MVNTHLTQATNKFLAIILAFVLFLGLASPQTVEANSDTTAGGGVSNLNVDFQGGRVDFSGGGFDENQDTDSVWGNILSRFHVQIAAVFGVFMLVALYKFGELLVKLIMSSDNPQGRGRVISGMIVSGIATAALGAATILFGFFYHMLL